MLTQHTIFYQLRWWKFWHDFSKHCEEKMCPDMINLSKRFFSCCLWQEARWKNSRADFPSLFRPCILLAKTLRCSHNIYNKVNKLNHSSLFTDLFTKTRSAAAAGIFVCHTLGAHKIKWNWTCLVPGAHSAQSIKAFVRRKTLFEIGGTLQYVFSSCL